MSATPESEIERFLRSGEYDPTSLDPPLGWRGQEVVLLSRPLANASLMKSIAQFWFGRVAFVGWTRVSAAHRRRRRRW